MAIADFADYQAKIAGPDQTIALFHTVFFPSGNGWESAWISAKQINGQGSVTPTAPAAAAAPTRTTSGAFGQSNPASGDLRMWIRAMVAGQGGLQGCSLMVADRLSHQGGLSAIVTGAQSTNLPTAALTRYTTGVGVFAALEIYTAIGATPTTATCTYTNHAGTGGKTSQAIAIGGTGLQNGQRFLPISLAAGDRGVRAVADVNLVASTGTAGNFGVTLYKPLLLLPVPVLADLMNSGDPLRAIGFYLPKIETDACLQFMACGGGQVTSSVAGELCFMES